MAKTIRCYVCGAIAWGRTESYGDDRCDDCINRSERLAEIESEDAPPEFKEGRKAFLAGAKRWDNPYQDSSLAQDVLWEQGWETERDRDNS